MIDILDVKLKVVKAACGITALSEIDLLHRLEELYLRGYKHGIDDMMEQAKKNLSDEKDCACPGGQAEHLNSCVYCR